MAQEPTESGVPCEKKSSRSWAGLVLSRPWFWHLLPMPINFWIAAPEDVASNSQRQNYGLLSTSPAQLRLDFFSHSTPDSVGSWSIDRQRWTHTSVE